MNKRGVLNAVGALLLFVAASLLVPLGVALAYGWLTERQWGVNVSVPVVRELSASVNYADTDERMEGAVLFFGADGRLAGVRRGLLRALTRELRRVRPAPVD